MGVGITYLLLTAGFFLLRSERNTDEKTFTTMMPDQVGAFLAASRVFAALGYLSDAENFGDVMLISRFQINICYLSSQENGTQYQYFRMGLLVQDNDESVAFFRTIFWSISRALSASRGRSTAWHRIS